MAVITRHSVTRHGLNRRSVLRGLLGGVAVSVALPFFEASIFGKAAHAQGAFPTRFGLFFWGNGMLPDRWVPSMQGTGEQWQLSPQLMPLASVKQHITVVTGTALKTPNEIPHHSGSAGVLTGRPVVVKSHEDQTFASPTIDQVIAQGIGDATRFRSLEVGCYGGGWGGISHNGPDNVNPAETSPAALFERLFGPAFRAPGDMTAVDPKLALRRSVLDAVMTDLRDFERGLGATDKARLDQHLTGLRELERRIARLEADPPALAACVRPPAPESEFPDLEGRPQLAEKNRVICDLVVMALACDQTRVFSHLITRPLTNLQIAGAAAGHHQLTHDEPDPQPQVDRIVLEIMQGFAYLIERMASIPEGDATLLDHSVVLATSDISLGRIHSLDEFPLVIAGSAGGRLKTGMHYRSPFAENTSNVMLSLVRAAGVNAGSWGGEDGYTEAGLGAIEV